MIITQLVALIATSICISANSVKRKVDIKQRVARVLKQNPIIDGHNDLPFTLKKLFDNDVSQVNLTQDLSEVDPFRTYRSSHTDIPRLKLGSVGGQFWSVYVRCNTQYLDAVERGLEQMDVVYKMVEQYPQDLVLATSSKDIEAAIADGKIASLMGVEGGHMINSNLAILRTFYRGGARYMTLTHKCNTPWVDSASVEDGGDIKPRNYGLSDFGVTVVKEMNRLGMLIDLSHVSADSMRSVISVSQAPVIFSHSGARTVRQHSRNVPDDVLQQLSVRDGIVMVIFYPKYVVEDSDTNNGNIKDIVKHIDHIRGMAGVNHIGIGSDYNGIGTTVEGLEDVSKLPALFEVLLEESRYTWTDEDLAKLANKNILRVMKKVEGVRDMMREKGESADNSVLAFSQEDGGSCRSIRPE